MDKLRQLLRLLPCRLPERQKFRDGLLSCSPADLASAAKKYLAGVPPAIAVVGSSEKAPLGDSEWINLDAQGNPRAS